MNVNASMPGGKIALPSIALRLNYLQGSNHNNDSESLGWNSLDVSIPGKRSCTTVSSLEPSCMSYDAAHHF